VPSDKTRGGPEHREEETVAIQNWCSDRDDDDDSDSCATNAFMVAEQCCDTAEKDQEMSGGMEESNKFAAKAATKKQTPPSESIAELSSMFLATDFGDDAKAVLTGDDSKEKDAKSVDEADDKKAHDAKFDDSAEDNQSAAAPAENADAWQQQLSEKQRENVEDERSAWREHAAHEIYCAILAGAKKLEET